MNEAELVVRDDHAVIIGVAPRGSGGTEEGREVGDSVPATATTEAVGGKAHDDVGSGGSREDVGGGGAREVGGGFGSREDLGRGESRESRDARDDAGGGESCEDAGHGEARGDSDSDSDGDSGSGGSHEAVEGGESRQDGEGGPSTSAITSASAAGTRGGDRPATRLDDLVGADLAEALEEWARVCTAVRRTAGGAGREVVSRRGRQLVGRVATVLGQPVWYRDPMTDETTLVQPPPAPRVRAERAAAVSPSLRDAPVADPTPWGTGLTVAGFVAVFVVVAMLALASSLAAETAGWVAVVAAAVVTGGLAPSLWLGRRVAVVRWIVLGAVVGTALSWIGVLLIAFA
ncbi:DUF2537 domain-containing protein [Saccharomonospora xinjiangensis]|uniref:DUF2537 domain-containing protein n=1 Tax=Saccharomonospora xinjiangensis XJ-54 TaxID=882086 RepID=I0V488_9PSEU|nr:DUF2537 domain-containing protein [Saccharomonospora xinjiangensis]EID54941.1 Protein of unknown function (DUF2537) [Saccharomonospora xinjiangensis XJ-54]